MSVGDRPRASAAPGCVLRSCARHRLGFFAVYRLILPQSLTEFGHNPMQYCTQLLPVQYQQLKILLFLNVYLRIIQGRTISFYCFHSFGSFRYFYCIDLCPDGDVCLAGTVSPTVLPYRSRAWPGTPGITNKAKPIKKSVLGNFPPDFVAPPRLFCQPLTVGKSLQTRACCPGLQKVRGRYP